MAQLKVKLLLVNVILVFSVLFGCTGALQNNIRTAYRSDTCSFSQPVLDRETFREMVVASNVDAIYDSLYSLCYVNPIVSSFDKRDTLRPYSPVNSYEFNCDSTEHISLIILDINKQFLMLLVNMEFLPGEHIVYYRGVLDSTRASVKSGIYLHLLIRDNEYQLDKFVLMR